MSKLLAFLLPNQKVKRIVWFRLGYPASVSEYPPVTMQVEFPRWAWKLFDDGSSHIQVPPYVAQASEQWQMRFPTHLPPHGWVD